MSKRKREENPSPLTEDIARAVFSQVERDDLDMLILAIQLNTTSYQFVQTQLVSLAEEVMARVEKLYLPAVRLSVSGPEQTLVERLVDQMFLSGMTLFTTKEQFQCLLKLDQTKLGRTLLKYLKLTQLKQKHLDENETHRGQDNCSPYRMLMDGPQPTTNLWNVFTLCEGRRYRRLFECPNIAVCDDMSQCDKEVEKQAERYIRHITNRTERVERREKFRNLCTPNHSIWQIRATCFELGYEDRVIKEAPWTTILVMF